MKTITIKVQEAKEKVAGVNEVVKYLKGMPVDGDDMRAEYEYFTVLYLNAKNKVIKAQTFGPGAINENVVYPGTILRIALLIGAVNIIFAHNHPTGDIKPSSADISMTHQFQEGAKLLGMMILDHIVYDHGFENYVSFVQEQII